jgi:hypothetical protein
MTNYNLYYNIQMNVIFRQYVLIVDKYVFFSAGNISENNIELSIYPLLSFENYAITLSTLWNYFT